ncbi:hypothetical protein [Leucothrix arctica]|uniref:DUF3551 domain-containing protein n=1 Tax=Leucothrix arctica TaxID=1481894 RepID=A0A317CHD4_9GAMM|nr:hypothetical protein [Leucothrix arctica]PWQ95700.1 hypothetical protein DKT75_11745 [Leucothrix arctica]
MKFQCTLVKKLLVLSAFTLLLPASYSYAHSGSTGNEPWKACTAKQKSQACEYTGAHDERYIGTCQSISLHMMCVRNQPIIQSTNKHDTQIEAKTMVKATVEAKVEVKVKEVPEAPEGAVKDSSK